MTALVDRYIAIWNERDAATRRELIEGTWSDDATYLDPMLQGDGHAGIDAMTQGVQTQFPNHSFRRTGEVDAHHDRIRFTWELAENGSAPLIAGVDYGVVAEDGRLRSITGFLDLVPDLSGGTS